jgi:Fe-S-cluster formation regulator IscX/YfhJ
MLTPYEQLLAVQIELDKYKYDESENRKKYIRRQQQQMYEKERDNTFGSSSIETKLEILNNKVKFYLVSSNRTDELYNWRKYDEWHNYLKLRLSSNKIHSDILMLLDEWIEAATTNRFVDAHKLIIELQKHNDVFNSNIIQLLEAMLNVISNPYF